MQKRQGLYTKAIHTQHCFAGLTEMKRNCDNWDWGSERASETNREGNQPKEAKGMAYGKPALVLSITLRYAFAYRCSVV